MLPELIPAGFASKSSRSIINRLNQSLGEASAVRACVCYWTQWPDDLHRNFTELLKWGDSFCCVDVKDTTDVDALCAFSLAGATEFFLYLKEVSEPREGQVRLRHNLMHTKMLVLDMPKGQAEVWVGSHNFTDRALLGANFEASTVTACTQESAFYWQCRSYVEHIRNECHRFDPSLRAAYKALQRSTQLDSPDDIYQVLPVVGNEVLALPGQTLLLLGDDDQELRRFGGVTPRQKRFLVRAGDLRSGQEHLIHARVQSSGLIDKLDEQSFGIDFSVRPYAIRRKGLIPYTSYRSKAFAGAELKRFKFWVNIKLGALAGRGEELQAVKAPPLAWWTKDAVATVQVRQAMTQDRLQRRQHVAPGWGEYPQRAWEQERNLREDLQPLAEVRVARFRSYKDELAVIAAREQEADSTARMLRAARPFYESEFQQVYFAVETEEFTNFRGEQEALVPPELRTMLVKALVQEKRWSGNE